MRIFAKTMRDLRQGLIGWGIGVVGLTAVMLAVWPSIRDMPGWEQLLEAYPAPMRELFDIESMTTGAGFLNAELFTLMIPLLDMGMSTVDIATATVAVTLLGVEHGVLALAIGAATGRRTLAVGVTSAVAAAGYAVYALARLVDSFEPWRVVSPFHHALIDGPLGAGARAEHLLLLAVPMIVLAAVIPRFVHRDVGTA